MNWNNTVIKTCIFLVSVVIIALVLLEWAAGCGETGGSCIWLGGSECGANETSTEGGALPLRYVPAQRVHGPLG